MKEFKLNANSSFRSLIVHNQGAFLFILLYHKSDTNPTFFICQRLYLKIGSFLLGIDIRNRPSNLLSMSYKRYPCQGLHAETYYSKLCCCHLLASLQLEPSKHRCHRDGSRQRLRRPLRRLRTRRQGNDQDAIRRIRDDQHLG